MASGRRIALLAVVLTLSLNGIAQSTAEMAAPSPLAPVAWLVGGTWVADIKNPQSGSVTHVENNIRWAPNHQAIDFVTSFNGAPHYNGMYAYNPATKAISFFYTSSEGELTIGTAKPEADGKTLHQDFELAHTNGQTEQIRSTILRDGENAYWFSVFLQDKGQWAQVFKIRYERK